jgi:hypothetical protein
MQDGSNPSKPINSTAWRWVSLSDSDKCPTRQLYPSYNDPSSAVALGVVELSRAAAARGS